MTKYTPATIAKAIGGGVVAAIGAAAAAAGGPDLSVLSAGEWAIAAGAGLTAFGTVFGTPNKDTNPRTPVDQVLDNLPVVSAAAASAAADLEKVKTAAAETFGGMIGAAMPGPIGQAILDALRKQ